MLQTIEKINSVVNNFVWGVPAMACIIIVGLYLSVRDQVYPDTEAWLCL